MPDALPAATFPVYPGLGRASIFHMDIGLLFGYPILTLLQIFGRQNLAVNLAISAGMGID